MENTKPFSKTREYLIWLNMKNRCYNPKNKQYHNYGGRGIIVCERWLTSAKNFVEDMGIPCNQTLTLERKDVNGNYCPENCIWTTIKEQCNNKRNNHLITSGGETLTVTQWSEKTSLNYRTILSRLDSGWTEEDSVKNTGGNNKYLTYRGKTENIAYWSSVTGLNRNTITERIKKGLTVEEILTDSPSKIPSQKLEQDIIDKFLKWCNYQGIFLVWSDEDGYHSMTRNSEELFKEYLRNNDESSNSKTIYRLA